LTCSGENQVLEEKGYQVGDVKFDTPLNFVGKIQSILEKEFSSLPIAKGKPFHCSDYEAAMDTLSLRFGSGNVHPGELFRMCVVIPELKPCVNCSAPPTVDVIYHIYTTDALYYATRVFEANHTALTRALAPPGTLSTTGSFQPLPFIGFNRSRKFVFGSKLSYIAPSGPLKSMDFDASGSGNSATASMFLSGAHQFQQSPVNYLRWRVGYQYENIPGDSLRLKSSRAVFTLLGATRALGELGTIVRFGSSIEGGNEQSSIGNVAGTPAGVGVLSNPYGSVKSYAGLTFNLGRQAFAGSYGVQFGSASSTPSLDYTKHLLNLSYSTRILFVEHKPTTIDAQFGAGYISGSETRIPVPERFFGGNVEHPFIAGDPWHFPGNPLFRSFSEYQFGRTSAGGGIGGKSFYAANLTVAQAVWGRPIVPPDLSSDPSFRRKLGGQIKMARETAKLSYLVDKPDFQAMVAKVSDARPLVESAQADSTRIRGMSSSLPHGVDIASKLDDLDDALKISSTVIGSVKTVKATAIGQLRTLTVGFSTDGSPDDCDQVEEMQSLFTRIRCGAEELNSELHDTSAGPDAKHLAALGQQVDQLRVQLVEQYGSLKAQAFLAPADAVTLADKLKNIDALLVQMSATAQPLELGPGAGQPQAQVLIQDIEEARSGTKSGAAQEAITSVGDWLAVGLGELTPPLLSTVVEDAQKVQEAAKTRPDAADALRELRAQTEQLSASESDLRHVMESVARPDVERRAIRDTRFAGRLLDVIFRELNLYTVSPFSMFDVARLGESHSPAFERARYTAGGGIRLSLVNFNVNIGYGWNANRQPGERAGAFYFSMNITDLFR